MYKNKETEILYEYLKEVIKELDKPLCLLGGWAVYFAVNSIFEKEKGYSYLGSRDIDLGFNDIKIIKKTILKLEKLGFKKVSFRFFKEIHLETKKELDREKAKKTSLHYIFPMYVDLIVSEINSNVKSELGFVPVDEPLLKYVFNNKYNKKLGKFKKEVVVPSEFLLLAMKICSIGRRSEGHKKVKDICDLVSLCLYSGVDLEKLKKDLIKVVSKKDIEKNLKQVSKENIGEVAKILDLEVEIINDLINRLLEVGE